MSLFDGKPIGRIDLNPRYEPKGLTATEMLAEAIQDHARGDEAARIWHAVRATAEGTNVSSSKEDA